MIYLQGQSPGENPKEVIITLVCQKGILEAEALALMASIKCYVSGNFRVVIVFPDNVEVRPNKLVLDYLQTLGAEVHEITNDESNYYMNKALAIKCVGNLENTENSRVLFLDSDRIFLDNCCVDAFLGSPEIIDTLKIGRPGELALKGRYRDLFSVADVKIPSKRYETIQFFNSSLISIDKRYAVDFVDLWVEIFRRLNSNNFLDLWEGFVEQTAFSLSVHKFGLEPSYEVSRTINVHPCLHYTALHKRHNESPVLGGFGSVIESHPFIKRILRSRPEFSFLFE